MPKSKWEFWIDRGGTFTDIVARSPQGKIISHKLLSEHPERYDDPIIQGIRDVLNLNTNEPISGKEIAMIKIGTTLATNTLLERKGEKVVLAITQGFGDALRIGYQNRPDLFALNIVLPPLLYDKVIEIEERVGAHGEILKRLDGQKTTQALQVAYQKGYRAIAIVLMHGYRYHHHEKQLRKIAKQIGFQQISVSHEVAPVMKLVGRGDTTVVDAYLSPVLQRYIQSLQKTLKHLPLLFMQSNGGLAEARFFRGKESIFSGPAAGVIGMVKTSQLAGFKKVIGFDMGGTSTDVSHFAGEYERSYISEFAGVRLQTPMMLIHTIAAGGGSILHFDGSRYIVGPDSAGANPGPSCYGRDGPLTITDCNVIVGKIQADFFPQVFGPQGGKAIDVAIVRKKFAQLTAEINQATGGQQTPEQVAEGYLHIAVENMANAIRRISVQRGYDVSQYLLNCFGAAAGQHACLVADRLGIKRILIHPLAGVLSAYGVGLAELRILKECPIEQPLKQAMEAVLKLKLTELEEQNQNALQAQGMQTDTMIHTRRIHLRYDGSDTMLTVEFSAIASMRKAFALEHRRQFGFASAQKSLIIEAVSVETVLATQMIVEKDCDLVHRPQKEIPVSKVVSLFSHSRTHQAPIYHRQDLQPGDCIQGCAIICENNATTIIEPGWQAHVTEKNHLLLTRYQPLPKQKITRTSVDPVLLEVFNNRFMNIAEQMGEVLRNTASSVNIKERLDFSCAIFDSQGELVANAPHIPVHLGSMSESVKSILNATTRLLPTSRGLTTGSSELARSIDPAVKPREVGDIDRDKQCFTTIRPGDVYLLNSPYDGGTHLPDLTVITPVFSENKQQLLFFLGSRGHHADIGGITPGSLPAKSKVIEEEGVLINHFKVVDQGRFLEAETLKLFTKARYPARNPKQNLEDLKAQIAANARGVHALWDLIAQFDLKVVQAYMKHVRDNATLAVRKLLTRLKDGHFCYHLDDGSAIKASITIDKAKKEACIDFTGSAPQHDGNFNAPLAISKAATLYVLRCLIYENIPLNGGCFVPIKIIVPPSSLLNPVYPAAVVAGNVETSQCIVDTLLGALGAVSASQGTCNNFTFGNAEYQYYETICGGAGAGPGFAGASAVHTHMTNTHLTDPEVLEWRFPVLLEEFSVRSNSGGKGKWCGGDGIIRRIRFLQPMTANIISSHRKIPPYGLQGGAPGKVGRNWVERANGTIEELDSCASVQMNAQDIFVIETPGGGGYGKP
ncbi:Acetone carboxylase beta subunit [Legionella lansingensis]|uniref:Acetophenone carboxylase gamma subunit n=1 Tax=Legionella lansingensis TaxID=45067 RepID=A0A0W0V7A9_9GAMM|nr:hydantoinase B/oxoprolinase family protein [Legionella lansingensis]KTD16007.1 Acetophenone carboxylase gamma subunit [Legionella lansingensis]SNV56192.1 Acetone carboxylase beta subunit [Legionella lansingensis]